MTRILCLHTAEIHVDTFGRLFSARAPDVVVTHVVRAEWLEEARQTGLTEALAAHVRALLAERAAQFDAVLCTCSTLGPIAEAAASSHRNIVRIDAPLMRQAASHDGVVLVAMCLASTRTPTLALLDAAFTQRGKQGRVESLVCADAWSHFERGEIAAFAEAIAARVRTAAAEIDGLACVVLAQASMAVAEPLLADLPVPVYASPPLAVAETLRVAGVPGPQQRDCSRPSR
jgi:hypothetical protein